MTAPPIALEALAHPGGVDVRVSGRSATSLHARFDLIVSVGSNRTVQSGEVTLIAGEDVMLSSVSVQTAQSVPWEAILRVVTGDRQPYEQVRRSA